MSTDPCCSVCREIGGPHGVPHSPRGGVMNDPFTQSVADLVRSGVVDPAVADQFAAQVAQDLRDMGDDSERSGMECGVTSPEAPGYGYAYCELRPGHDGPHREREDGHVWEAES